MTPPPEADPWSQRILDTYARYSEERLREVVAKLVKPRTQLPAGELAEKCLETLLNPPVIDRRIKELPPAGRAALTLIGLSRRPTWKVGHLVMLLASLGHHEGYAPILGLLELGLLMPDLPPVPPLADPEAVPRLDQFESWLGSAGTLTAPVFVHPAVAARARAESLSLPVLEVADAPPGPPRHADGLDWPLRLALVWQQLSEAPVRLTQAHTLFKRDLARLQADELLGAPTPDQPLAAPDSGVLALFWAEAAGLLALSDGELRVAPFPPSWQAALLPTLTDLWAGLTAVEPWEPGRGYAPPEEGLSSTPTAGFLTLLLLSRQPAGVWFDAKPLADWLWEHHPAWQGTLTPAEARERGRGWVEAYLLGVAYPLRFIEAAQSAPDDADQRRWRVRLSDVGRHLLAGEKEPVFPPIAAQALLVQPNAEVLAYRQGLTPGLVGKLTRLAKWKALGPACTLELTAAQTYQGLESGLSLAGMLQTLNQHALKPVPPTVADLLKRWADKRDRITVLASATLVEFQTPADLDSAIARGIVSIRVTDRIGLTDDGRDPEFKQLRLVGNRDYEAKAQQCLGVAPDGVTLTIDGMNGDLLLEAEIVRLADPVAGDPSGLRRFRLTPSSLKRATSAGLGLGELDGWFHTRAGQALPPAAKLFLAQPSASPHTATHLVVHTPSEELADGLVQWPPTATLLGERLGPKAVAITRENLVPLQAVLAELGLTVDASERD